MQPNMNMNAGNMNHNSNAGSGSNANMTADRNLLSDKELHYIKDYLSWELLAMKKCSDAANACTDPQIKQLIQQTGLKHQQHYETILSHLH